MNYYKSIRMLKIFTIMFGSASVMIVAGYHAFRAYFLHQAAKQMGFDLMKQAGSIGVIGGADGPTAVFVSSAFKPALGGPYVWAGICALLALCGLATIFVLKKRAK